MEHSPKNPDPESDKSISSDEESINLPESSKEDFADPLTLSNEEIENIPKQLEDELAGIAKNPEEPLETPEKLEDELEGIAINPEEPLETPGKLEGVSAESEKIFGDVSEEFENISDQSEETAEKSRKKFILSKILIIILLILIAFLTIGLGTFFYFSSWEDGLPEEKSPKIQLTDTNSPENNSAKIGSPIDSEPPNSSETKLPEKVLSPNKVSPPKITEDGPEAENKNSSKTIQPNPVEVPKPDEKKSKPVEENKTLTQNTPPVKQENETLAKKTPPIKQEDKKTLAKTSETNLARSGSKETKKTVEKKKSSSANLKTTRVASRNSKNVNLWHLSALNYQKDPWLWKYVLFKNKDKIHSIIFDKETRSWQVKTKFPETLRVNPLQKTLLPSFRNRLKYAVQLVAIPERRVEEAIKLNKALISKGYYAYLYRTREKIYDAYSDKKEFFYRIRIGLFKTSKEALETGEEIYRQYEGSDIFPSNFFVIRPDKEEAHGGIVEFGIQNQRPFVLEVYQGGSFSKALQINKDLNKKARIAYIVKTRIKGRDFYQVRYGFYSTLSEAKSEISGLKKTYGRLRIVRLNDLFEAALGQNTGNQAGKLLLGRPSDPSL